MIAQPRRRLVQMLLFLVVGLLTWLVGFRSSTIEPVLPETTSQFSLDMEVVGAVDAGLVYVLEQRARPWYRIFAFDPSSGEDTTVFAVPEDAIIYGMALAPDDSALTLAYSPDFHDNGNAIWSLDPVTGAIEERVPLTSGVWYSDLTHASPSSVLATRVDRRTGEEELSVVQIDLLSQSQTVVAVDAVDPAVTRSGVAWLAVDEDGGRRSAVLERSDGQIEQLALGNGVDDLDNLIGSADAATVWLSILDPLDDGLSIGTAANAHGNHDRPSNWWSLDQGASGEVSPGAEGTIVYSGATDGETIFAATREGLSVMSADGETIDVIKSRALRMVAA